MEGKQKGRKGKEQERKEGEIKGRQDLGRQEGTEGTEGREERKKAT